MWNGSFKSVTVSFVSWISLLVDARHRPRAAVRSRSGGGAARGSRPGLGCWGLGAAVCRAPAVLVTALNSAPVIFYPTDTFAELEPWFFSGRQLWFMHASIDGRLTTSLYSHCRYSGRVVSAVLENVLGTRFESQRRINQPTTLTGNCAGMPPSVQAAKPGLRRGAVNGQR